MQLIHLTNIYGIIYFISYLSLCRCFYRTLNSSGLYVLSTPFCLQYVKSTYTSIQETQTCCGRWRVSVGQARWPTLPARSRPWIWVVRKTSNCKQASLGHFTDKWPHSKIWLIHFNLKENSYNQMHKTLCRLTTKTLLHVLSKAEICIRSLCIYACAWQFYKCQWFQWCQCLSDILDSIDCISYVIFELANVQSNYMSYSHIYHLNIPICLTLFLSCIQESGIHGGITCDHWSNWKGCCHGGNYHTDKRSWIYGVHSWNCGIYIFSFLSPHTVYEKQTISTSKPLSLVI